MGLSRSDLADGLAISACRKKQVMLGGITTTASKDESLTVTDAEPELTVVPMGFLVKSGLFKKKNFEVQLSFNHVILIVKYDDVTNKIQLKLKGEYVGEWSIGINFVYLDMGFRYYFDTDNNQKSQSFIILFEGNLYSRKTLLENRVGIFDAHKKRLIKRARNRAKFFVPPGTSSLRTRRLAGLARKTLTQDEFDKLPREAIEAFESARMIGQLRQCGDDATNVLSSNYAITNAPEPDPNFIRYLAANCAPAELRAKHESPIPPDDIEPSRIDTCCWIDIADINRAGLLRPGQLSSLDLAWPLANTNDRDIKLISDSRDQAYPVLLFEILKSDVNEAIWQRVILTQTERRRWYFLCPIDGHRCDTLYLRGNRFGSWQAQKLYHPSQRGRQ